MELVNLTPHAVRIKTDNGEILEIPPSGILARVQEFVDDDVPIHSHGIHVVRVEYGEVSGLPDPTEDPNRLYIVSAFVLQAPSVKNRMDVFAPGTGHKLNPVRLPNGQVDYVTCLVAP